MSYHPTGVHVERRVVVDDGDLGISTYPVHKGVPATTWTDKDAPMPAPRARIERRVTVSFALPWLPWRWVKGSPDA